MINNLTPVFFIYFFIWLSCYYSTKGDQIPGVPISDRVETGEVNFRCVQIWLVMSMQFIFGDDLNDAPYWSRFASLAIFVFLNKLTQSIRKQIENENYFKRDISRPSIKKEATLLQRRIRRVRKQGNSNSRELRYYVSQNNYLKQFVELYSNIDSMSMAESLCCMYLIARSSQLWRC